MQLSKLFKYLLFETEMNGTINYKAENNNKSTWWGINKWQELDKEIDYID